MEMTDFPSLSYTGRKHEKGTPFEQSLPVQAIRGSMYPRVPLCDF